MMSSKRKLRWKKALLKAKFLFSKVSQRRKYLLKKASSKKKFVYRKKLFLARKFLPKRSNNLNQF